MGGRASASFEVAKKLSPGRYDRKSSSRVREERGEEREVA